MRVLLMANGPFSEATLPYLEGEAALAAVRIGVDGGARTLLRYGLPPDIVTGDGDSLSDAEREALVAAGAQLIPTPDQDYTDLDKALTYARTTLGARQATVFGATGGRLDHSYSVFSALIKHGPSLELRLVDALATYSLVVGTQVWEGDTLPGATLSLLAFGRVEGVTTTGVRWPLTDDWLEPGRRDGTLNQITQSRVTLTVGSGNLIAMVHHESARGILTRQCVPTPHPP